MKKFTTPSFDEKSEVRNENHLLEEKKLKLNQKKEKFIEAIIKFKNENHILEDVYEQNNILKLHDLFNLDKGTEEEKSQKKQLQKKFFSTPEILDYLSRDANFVQFGEDNNPFLISDASSKETKKSSDYYENRIYELIRTSPSKIYQKRKVHHSNISFRSNVAQFYEIGTIHSDIKFHLEKISKNVENTYIANVGDIYDIRTLVNKVYVQDIRYPDPQSDCIRKNSNIRFLLTNNHKDGHATILVHILDNDKKTLSTVFINSWLSSEYTRYIEKRFNPANNNNIPFIDASHHIQTDKNDANCMIYAINFTHAISQMLKDTVKADEIYQLAKKINAGDKDAELKIKSIFQEDLKQYLPMYYDSNDKAKSEKQLKDYHLKKRWNIGSENLLKKYGSDQNITSIDLLEEEVILKRARKNTASIPEKLKETPASIPEKLKETAASVAHVKESYKNISLQQAIGLGALIAATTGICAMLNIPNQTLNSGINNVVPPNSISNRFSAYNFGTFSNFPYIQGNNFACYSYEPSHNEEQVDNMINGRNTNTYNTIIDAASNAVKEFLPNGADLVQDGYNFSINELSKLSKFVKNLWFKETIASKVLPIGFRLREDTPKIAIPYQDLVNRGTSTQNNGR